MLKDTQTAKILHKLRPDDDYEFVGTQAFRVTRRGDTFKLFHEPKENGSTEVLSEVINAGVLIPTLRKIEEDEKGIYKYYDYWPGRTFEELIRAREILPEHYEMLGRWLAQVNSIEKKGLRAGFINYLPKNIVLRNDGEVFVCDHNKLVWSPLCENAIVRYILTEDLVDNKEYTFELRRAFLKGYRDIRNLSLLNILKKQSKLIYGDEDVYIRVNSFKETPFYKPVKSGKNVLTLRFFKGEQAFDEMYSGAEYSYACDIYHVRIGQELFKSSDYGKLIAYAHEFDGRDLHYKWIELNSAHFIEHLEHTFRKWDKVYLNGIFEAIAPEHGERLKRYLETLNAEIV